PPSRRADMKARCSMPRSTVGNRSGRSSHLERPCPSGSRSRKLEWIILLAFAARVAVRLYTGEREFWEHGYTFFFALAQNIAAGNGISFGGGPPTAFRVPLYPMFLAAVTLGYQAFLPVLLAQSLIGAGTALCAALIARELFGNTAAIIAAVLVAIYPY